MINNSASTLLTYTIYIGKEIFIKILLTRSATIPHKSYFALPISWKLDLDR